MNANTSVSKLLSPFYNAQSEFGLEVPLYEVEATSVEPTFDELYSYLFGLPPAAHSENDMNGPVPSAIFILNLDKVCLST